MIMDNENPSFVGLEEDTSLNDFKPRKDCKVIINHLTSPESMTSSQDDYSQADLFTDPNHLRHYSANDAAAYFSVVSNDNTFEFNKKRRLRYDIVLEAATAVTQKTEETAITYLNRGQLYAIQLSAKQATSQIITSTLSIEFHNPSHRRIAENYWNFWVTQQKQAAVRAIDLDTHQSVGISDLSFPSFDKITFKWRGHYGAKLFVRFKCLSTDFSRIKGVKGIPLRVQMESSADPYIREVCFCKVKLFRDKGAERKNKDDAKQISKQLEKIYGNASKQSLPLMYNASIPYSVFGEIPNPSPLDTFEHALDDMSLPNNNQTKTPARYHTRVMTAPTSFFYGGATAASSYAVTESINTTSLIDNTNAMDHVLFQSMNIPPPPPPLPAINTNVLETLPILDNTNDEMPPLSKDNIYTPTTFMQPTPTDLAYQSYSSTINHHPGVYPISTTATSTSSLTSYQEFTPSPSVDYFCQDLFTNDDAKNNISYPQPLSFRKSRKRGFEHVESPDSQPYLLTYSTNPSHLTLLNGKRVHL